MRPEGTIRGVRLAIAVVGLGLALHAPRVRADDSPDIEIEPEEAERPPPSADDTDDSHGPEHRPPPPPAAISPPPAHAAECVAA